MKCQNCNKNDANVKYYENINGKQKEVMLCSKCAEKFNLIDFPDMLSFFVSNHPKELYENDYLDTVCDKCSYTFDDYLNTGFFGCDNCYNAFSDRIDSLLSKMYGKNRHKLLQDYSNKKESNKTYNKKDEEVSNITDIKVLKDRLEKDIKNENYEEAAVIRDRIKKIEGE
ncbi:MAG: UvrB/UvrC motif-containing protein [Clostridia bacterium]